MEPVTRPHQKENTRLIRDEWSGDRFVAALPVIAHRCNTLQTFQALNIELFTMFYLFHFIIL